MSELDHFRQTVASSKILTDRWNAVCEAAQESALREGIRVSREDLIKLDSIRIHVTSGQEAGIHWREEASKKLPAFAQKDESRKLRETLTGDDTAEAAAAKKEWESLSIHQRMAKARELDAANKPEPKAPLSDAERKTAIERLKTSRGAERIRLGRLLGTG